MNTYKHKETHKKHSVHAQDNIQTHTANTTIQKRTHNDNKTATQNIPKQIHTTHKNKQTETQRNANNTLIPKQIN